MNAQQPEALDLADWLEAVGGGLSAKRCAALLREQHARIAELEAQLESIGAGGVNGPLMGRAADHFPGVTKMVARWYMIDKNGVATLCTDREDAERYRWLKSQSKEQLLNPRGAASEFCADMRTHWKLPVLMCSGPIGGYLSFDDSVDILRAAQEGK